MEQLEQAPHSGRPPEVTMIHWGCLDTPLGRLFVAVSPRGVVSVGTSDGTESAFLARAEAELGARTELAPGPAPLLDRALDELAAYFAGTCRSFTVPLDWRLLRGAFNARILESLCAVPWGHLVSYSELARRAGAPRAARAAGSACKANPLPILVPCHRVVHANGGIGGYSGPGVAYKRGLLAIEEVVFPTR
ncbi:MAG TPA: methylated-DNA--[protein]-cysteine S-methyltransferase [Chloroflexia bacterium]|nr:methylated-DNA--[protein]-cysteine S-methyltransferase [Chloroflexia bacterium]